MVLIFHSIISLFELYFFLNLSKTLQNILRTQFLNSSVSFFYILKG